jgi:hypothetical protein
MSPNLQFKIGREENNVEMRVSAMLESELETELDTCYDDGDMDKKNVTNDSSIASQ